MTNAETTVAALPTAPVINLAPGVNFSIETVTERAGIFGRSGSGKTHTGSVEAEEMLAAGAHIVVLDPLGVWWGLRAVPEGQAETTTADVVDMGPPRIYILGGSRADLPLDPQAGAAIADLVIEEKLSVILDMSDFDDDEQRSLFAAAFARQLFTKNEVPLHIFCDEADLFVPQMPDKGAEWACRKAFDSLVRRGRVKGVGITLISQRPAVVAKNALTQITTLIVHQLTGPQDQAAVGAWFKEHGTAEQQKEVSSSLPQLAPGEAWIWSPNEGMLQRVKVRARKSFDSSATPKFGAAPITAKRLAAPDLSALAARLAASVEAAQENDPAILQKRIADASKEIAELKRQIAERVKGGGADKSGKGEPLEVSVLPQKDVETLRSVANDLIAALGKHETKTAQATPIAVPPVPTQKPKNERVGIAAPAPAKVAVTVNNINAVVLPIAQQRYLDSLSAMDAVGVRNINRAQLAATQQYTAGAAAFERDLGTLRKQGFIDCPSASEVALTAKGKAQAQGYAKPQSTGDALALWKSILTDGLAEILEVLFASHPRQLGRETIAQRVGVPAKSRGLSCNLGLLKVAGLVEYPMPSKVRATELVLGKVGR